MTEYPPCEECGSRTGQYEQRSDGRHVLVKCFVCIRKFRQKLAAEARRANPRALAGIDIDLAVAAFKKLPVFTDHKLPRSFKVDVVHRAYNSRGTAWRTRIRVCASPSTAVSRVLEIVLHELCHLACPGAKHNEHFRLVFARAVREAWGISVATEIPRGRHECIAYAMGDVVTEQLEAKLNTGEIELGHLAPKPKVPKAVTAAERVEKRAAHAARMLARAETRLKRARTLHRKWAAKVRRYERQAARKP